MWQASALDEESFVGALRTAKLTIRKVQAHGVVNKGAYWFRVLRDQLALGGPDRGPLAQRPIRQAALAWRADRGPLGLIAS
jgi:hypothetical protein